MALRAVLVIVAASGALCLSACTARPVSSAGVATYSARASGGNAASISGALYLRDGCLRFALDNGQDVVPVFPNDAVLDNSVANLTWAGGVLPLGRLVRLGGGVMSGRPTDVMLPCSAIPDETYLIVANP